MPLKDPTMLPLSALIRELASDAARPLGASRTLGEGDRVDAVAKEIDRRAAEVAALHDELEELRDRVRDLEAWRNNVGPYLSRAR